MVKIYQKLPKKKKKTNLNSEAIWAAQITRVESNHVKKVMLQILYSSKLDISPHRLKLYFVVFVGTDVYALFQEPGSQWGRKEGRLESWQGGIEGLAMHGAGVLPHFALAVTGQLSCNPVKL